MAKSNLAIGAIVGAAIGAVAGVLVAPKSGKETRDDIKAKAGELKNTAAEKAAQVEDKVKSSSEDVKQKADGTLTKLTDMFKKDSTK